MMDFDNILDIASQNQGGGGSQRRYSLQTGPPKKDARAKGVNPAAIQALLKKKNMEARQKEMEMKKQKDGLLAKRVELKSDRKARAMASRTKDNFHGYNGIPVVELPKKRRTKQEMLEGKTNEERFGNHTMDPEDDEDNYEYEQSDSDSEQQPVATKPGRPASGGISSSSSKLSSKKFSGVTKPAPPPLNFADLLKLAEKKQFEPVDLKPKKVVKEERLRTADEIKELEMERKARRPDKDRESRQERDRDGKSQSSSGPVRKSTLEKEQRNNKVQKSLSGGAGKKAPPTPSYEKGLPHPKSSVGDREREKPKKSLGDRDKLKTSAPGSSGAANSKVPPKTSSSQVSTKPVGTKSPFNHKPSSDLSSKKESSSLLSRKPPGIPATKSSGLAGSSQKSQHGGSQQTRPGPAGPSRHSQIQGGPKAGKGDPLRPGMNAALKSSANSASRLASGGPPKPGGQPQVRPGGGLQPKPGAMPQAKARLSGPPGHPGGSGSRPQGVGPGRPGAGLAGSARPGSSTGSGPGRPKCTVVSETISSRNVGGARPGGPPQLGMPPRPGMPIRPGMNRPPVPMLPPITSAYKRKYEEEEYDSEMDDFIDDEGEEQDEISKHIREIFGYDRNKYRDESDYALKFMESSWKDMQKEEARSLRMAVQEDLEEEKREMEELKKQTTKKRKT